MINEIELSLVIPVFNSEGNLEPLVKEIINSLNNTSFEIIFVNDQSSDKSWEVISNLAMKYEFIKGINFRKNSGQDNAIICGLKYSSGNFMVIMDDDLQHSPNDIQSLHLQILKGFDIVYANFKRKKQAAWKNLGSWFNGKMAEILIKKPRGIYLSPFKILTREIVTEILKYKGPYPYIDGLIFMITTNISQVENIEHHSRHTGKSNFNLVRSIRVFLKLATNFSIIPLRISTILGFVSSLLSFVLGLYFLGEYLILNSIPEGYTSIILVLLFLGGLILISLGMIGEYLGRLFMNTNRIAPYIIKDFINIDQ